MDILQTIESDLKEALKKGEAIRLRLLRGLRAALYNAKIAKRAVLEQADVLKVIQMELKKRKEAIEAFIKAGREQSAKEEQEEADILTTFLPKQLSDEELESVISKKAEAMNVSDMKGFGKLMGAVMKEVGATASGDRVREKIEKRFK